MIRMLAFFLLCMPLAAQSPITMSTPEVISAKVVDEQTLSVVRMVDGQAAVDIVDLSGRVLARSAALPGGPRMTWSRNVGRDVYSLIIECGPTESHADCAKRFRDAVKAMKEVLGIE